MGFAIAVIIHSLDRSLSTRLIVIHSFDLLWSGESALTRSINMGISIALLIQSLDRSLDPVRNGERYRILQERNQSSERMVVA